MAAFRPLHAVLLLIAAAAIMGPVWAVLDRKPVAQPSPVKQAAAPAKSVIPDSAQIARFEAMAVSACQCAKDKDEAGIGACWTEFDKTTAPFGPEQVVSMCMDSNESLCFGMGDGIVTPEVAKRIKCISVNRSASGICTEADARTAAAAKASGTDC